MLPNPGSISTSDQDSDSSQTTERLDYILNDLLGNLSLGTTNMTIKNRKDRTKHEQTDRSRDCDISGPSSSRSGSFRASYLLPELSQSANRLKTEFQSSTSSQDKDSHGPKRIRRAHERKGNSIAIVKSSVSQQNDDTNNSEDEYCASSSSVTNNNKLEENLNQILKEKRGWQLVEVENDGACLFRSVAHQIFGDEEKHDVIRKQACDYMLKNREHFSHYVTEDFEHYIARKQHPNCHGNHVEIQAIAELYNRPVEIYRDNIEPVNVFHAEYRNNAPIRLSYHGHVHYNSIVDPYNPTFGLGLGMPNYQPGLPESQLVQKAINESEETQIEDAMLRDKMLETDQGDIERRIEEQVMRESYYDFLKSKGKNDTIGSSSRTSPRVNSAAARSLLATSTRSGSPPIQTAATAPPVAKAFTTNESIDFAILRNVPAEMLDMDEDALMALVMDQSRHEFMKNISNNRQASSSIEESSASFAPAASDKNQQ